MSHHNFNYLSMKATQTARIALADRIKIALHETLIHSDQALSKKLKKPLQKVASTLAKQVISLQLKAQKKQEKSDKKKAKKDKKAQKSLSIDIK